MEVNMTVVFLGLCNSGKTALIHSAQNNHEEIFPTAGIEISYIPFGIKPILAYDCSGEGVNRENWTTFSEIADSLIYVIDAADVRRFANAKEQLFSFLEKNKFVK